VPVRLLGRLAVAVLVDVAVDGLFEALVVVLGLTLLTTMIGGVLVIVALQADGPDQTLPFRPRYSSVSEAPGASVSTRVVGASSAT
jgi:hypothetical protein